jgi:hypothetical protein
MEKKGFPFGMIAEGNSPDILLPEGVNPFRFLIDFEAQQQSYFPGFVPPEENRFIDRIWKSGGRNLEAS